MKKRFEKVDKKVSNFWQEKFYPRLKKIEDKASFAFEKLLFPLIEKAVIKLSTFIKILEPSLKKILKFSIRLLRKIFSILKWTFITLILIAFIITLYYIYVELNGQKQNKKVYKEILPLVNKINYYKEKQNLDSCLIFLDSAITVVNHRSDSIYSGLLAQKAEVYFLLNDSILAERIAREVNGRPDNDFPHRNNYEADKKVQMILAKLWERSNSTGMSETLYKSVLSDAIENKDTIIAFESFVSLLRIYRKNKEIKKSVKIFTEQGEEFLSKVRFEDIPKDLALLFYDELIYLYTQVFWDQELAEMYKQSWYDFPIKSPATEAEVLFKIGNAYEVAGIPDSAINYYKQSLNISRNINYKELIQENYQHLSISLTTIEEYQKSLNLADSSLFLSLQLENPKSIFSSYVIMSEGLLKSGEVNKAKSTLEKAKTLYEGNQNTPEYLKSIYIDSQIQKKLGNYKKAYDLLYLANEIEKENLNEQITDSKHNISDFAIEVMKSLSLLREEQKQKEDLQISNRKNNFSYWSWLIGGVLFVGIASFFVRKSYISILQKNKALSDAKEIMGTPEFLSTGKITLKNGKSIELSDIIMIEKLKNKDKVVFFTESRGKIEEYTTLDKLETGGDLPQQLFVRTHQSYIINVLKVHEQFKSRRILIMKGGFEAKVSRSNSKKVFSDLQS